MKCVKLAKGMDYRGHGVRAFSGKPLQVEDEKADELIATGFFKLSEVPVQAQVEKSIDDGAEDKPIDKMTKDELIAFAEQNGIDISACQNNDERKATIKSALESTDDGAKAGFEE